MRRPEKFEKRVCWTNWTFGAWLSTRKQAPFRRKLVFAIELGPLFLCWTWR